MLGRKLTLAATAFTGSITSAAKTSLNRCHFVRTKGFVSIVADIDRTVIRTRAPGA